MPRFIATFIARQPGQVPLESTTNAPPFRVSDGFVHLLSEGKEVLVVPVEDFLGIGLAAKPSRIVSPHGGPDA